MRVQNATFGVRTNNSFDLALPLTQPCISRLFLCCLLGCGVILYALLCGSLPFDDENIRALFRKIKGGIYTIPTHVSFLAKDLLSKMLVVDPLKRISIEEIM